MIHQYFYLFLFVVGLGFSLPSNAATCTQADGNGALSTSAADPLSCAGDVLLSPTEYSDFLSLSDSSGGTDAVSLNDLDPAEIAIAFGGGFGLITVCYLAGFSLRFLLSII